MGGLSGAVAAGTGYSSPLGNRSDGYPVPAVGSGRAADDYVFGYGSLAGDLLAEVVVAQLLGYRREFGVAANNSEEIAGYKRYRVPDDESYPEVFVAFLDIVEEPGAEVNGVLAPIDAEALADLDRRERNYDRADVTEAIENPPDGRVWAYVGSPDGRARLATGMADGTAVVQRSYLDHVKKGFRRLGEAEYERFLATTSVDGLPLLDLDRVDIPADGAS